MTLRLRLFLVLGGLAASLVLAQWWWVRSLTRELTQEVDSVAMLVGSSVATLLSTDDSILDVDCREGACDQRIRVVERIRRDDDSGPVIIHTPAGVGTFEPRTITMRFDTDDDGDLVIDEFIEGDADGDSVSRQVQWAWKTTIEELRSDAPAESTEPAPIRPPDDTSQPGDDERSQAVVRVEPRIEIVEGATAHFIRYSDDSHPPDHLHPSDLGEDGFGFHAFGSAGDLHTETRFLVLDRPDGTARVPIPQRGLEAKLDDFRSRLMLGSFGLLAVALTAAALLAHRVSAPLRGLTAAADEVGAGELGVQVDTPIADREVQRTIDAFNLMSRRLVELDARARRADALRHLGELGDVARGLAHTLRNPLNALGLSVDELAARVDEPSDTDDLADAAKRQIRRIDQGIRSFLVLASPTGGAVEPVDIGELVRDVALEALQDSGGKARIEVETPSARHLVDAVGPELRAAIQALVVNAVEASPEGGVVEVALHADPPADGAAQHVTLTVDDRGPGLPEAIRERLFTPHLSTKSNGSGMGLFLAHRVAVHRYGGRLELTDRDGGGTRAELVIGPRRSLEASP